MDDPLTLLLKLRNEVNCRREHGANGAEHLAYIEGELDKIIQTVREEYEEEERCRPLHLT